MLPANLKPEHFRAYPPQARRLLLAHLEALKRLPLSFLPNLLREAISYNWKFPVESQQLESELINLSALSREDVGVWFQQFFQIHLSANFEQLDWVNAPGEFVEQLSSYLWTTHQVDAFRLGAVAYADRLRRATPQKPPAIPRLVISVIGRGVTENKYPLFRKLRPHGVYFNAVRPENGLKLLMKAVTDRASRHPTPYGHWYVDGEQAVSDSSELTCLSYHALNRTRDALLRRMQTEIQSGAMGPETLRTILARLRPEDLQMADGDPVLNRFQLSLLTEGSGTQVFGTTFTQWAAREVLRRAQPLSLLVRFAPRQRQRPMNELQYREAGELDCAGSLIDADMGAYYNWLNLQRLPGGEQSSFLVWFEDHNEALAISPALAKGTESRTTAGVRDLLAWIG